MEIAKQIGGFTPAEADDLRKAIGKKIHSLMASLKDKFLEDRAYKAGVSLVLSKEENMGRVADYARILLKPDAPKGPATKQ